MATEGLLLFILHFSSPINGAVSTGDVHRLSVYICKRMKLKKVVSSVEEEHRLVIISPFRKLQQVV